MKSVQSETKSGLPAALGAGAGGFDSGLVNCKALVIDSNPTARSIQAAQLYRHA